MGILVMVWASSAGAAPDIATEAEFTNSIGMKFVRIDPGTFVMGTDEGAVLPDALTTDLVGEKDGPMAQRLHGDFDEHPAHEVVVTKPFHMAVTEVTNAQFEAFDFTHGHWRGKEGFSCMDDEAVVFVSWHEAVAFCEWLSEKEGLPYRLPTEAEWEYACRAGTRTAFSTGDALPEAFHKNVFESWHPDADPSRITEKFRKPERRYTDNIVPLTVAQTPPNPCGLHDMHGNVEEWCLDWYGPYEPGRQTDPVGRVEGDFRVTRGGSHSTELYFLRSANRMGTLPEDRSWLIGFRVVVGELPATEPLPRPAPPANQQGVSQEIPKTAKTGDAPYFEGPRQYVKIDENAHGPLFIDHNHDPGIAPCPNGDLLAIWYTTCREKGRELCLAASRLRYGQGEWDQASLFWLAPDRNLHAPSIWLDKDAGMLYQFVGLSAAATWGNLAAVMRTSSDSGATWSAARLIAPAHGLRHQMSEPVIRTRDGALMVANDANDVGGTSLLISRDNGETWADSGGVIRGIHGGVVELRDGRLFGLGRGNDIDGHMPASYSLDQGKTWTYAPSPFQPVGGGQRLVLLRLEEGPILLVSFATDIEMVAGDGARRVCSGMFAALSFDEAETWPVMRLVTPGGPAREVGTTNNSPFTLSGVSAEPRGYLSGCQGYDSVIHIISSFQHYAFNLGWLMEGGNAASKQQARECLAASDLYRGKAPLTPLRQANHGGSTMERSGEVTFKGNPLTLIGPKLAVGGKAPEFDLLANDLTPVKLSDSAGKVRLISVVPSLDTPVCDTQTRTFNEQLSALGDGVVGLTISADLPFAQARFCGAAGIKRIQTLSDHRSMAFGDAYGTHIKELRLESRAVFVVDGGGTIRYVQYVGEITELPDHDAALAAVKATLG